MNAMTISNWNKNKLKKRNLKLRHNFNIYQIEKMNSFKNKRHEKLKKAKSN